MGFGNEAQAKMVGTVTFTITGAKELEKNLKEMGPKLAVRVGDKALREAARIVAKEAKRLCPRQTGALRRSIGAVKGKDRNPEIRSYIVGFKRPGRRYAHLVEFGHSGNVAARPFLRPALDNKAREALNEISDKLADGILRAEWRKAVGLIAAGEEIEFGGE